jgi:hypothetical protein
MPDGARPYPPLHYLSVEAGFHTKRSSGANELRVNGERRSLPPEVFTASGQPVVGELRVVFSAVGEVELIGRSDLWTVGIAAP